MSKSLPEILDQFPLEERAQLSDQYAKWYNVLLKLYAQDFSISEDDDCKRTFKSEEQVVLFFQTALMWWYNKKPVLTDPVSPLDAIKTWTCLGQIQALKNKLEETGIPIEHLKLNEHFDRKCPVKKNV